MANLQKSKLLARRAWAVLRTAFLWARRGGSGRHLRLAVRYLKSLRSTRNPSDRIGHGAVEMSFEETPMFNFKLRKSSKGSSMMLLRSMACISSRGSSTSSPYFGDRRDFGGRGNDGVLLEEEDGMSVVGGEYWSEEEAQEEESVDVKAERFIKKFYEEMKLQRQVSWLQYNEMLYRSAC